VHVLAALALGAGAFVALGAAPASAVDPLGYVIVQGEGECWLASVDLVTGETTQIGTPSGDKCAFDLEFTPDGTRLVGTRVVDSGDGEIAIIVEFDLTTGAVTTLSQLGDFPVGGPGEEQGNITFGPDHELYTYLVPDVLSAPIDSQAVDPACDGSAFCLFHVDHENPTVVTYINSVPQQFTVYDGLATSCAGVTSSMRDVPRDEAAGLPLSARWDAATAADASQFLTRVNLTSTGPGTTDVGPIPDVQLSSLDYDTAGTLYAVGFVVEEAGPSLMTLDPSTGAPTTVAPLNDGETRLNVGVLGFAIPHPCSPAPPPAPPAPPAAQPIAAVTPRFTG
jgi:hypothetical protein